MKIVESKSNLMFDVEDIVTQHRQVVHANQMLQYTINYVSEQILHEMRKQVARHEASYH